MVYSNNIPGRGSEVGTTEPAAWSAGLRVTASEAATPEAAWPQRAELVYHNPAAFSGRFGVRTLHYLFQGTRAIASLAAVAASAVTAAPGRGVESAAEAGDERGEKFLVLETGNARRLRDSAAPPFFGWFAWARHRATGAHFARTTTLRHCRPGAPRGTPVAT